MRGLRREDCLPPQPEHDPLPVDWVDFVHSAASRCRVMLTGEGGDVILTTSPSYLHKMVKGFRLMQLAIELGRCLCNYGRIPQLGLRTRLRRWLSLNGDQSLYPSLA